MKQIAAFVFVVLSISHCFVLACPPPGNDLYDKTLQPVIGIDLGFTNSRVGVYRNDRLDIITDSQGNECIPSYIAFTPDGHRLVGEAAKNQSLLNPANTIFAVNRLVGHKFIDKDVQTDLSMYPFKTLSDENGYSKIQVEEAGVTKLFTPEEILAIYLQYIKATANEFLGQNVTNALISVPAYFNDAQRQAIKNAGEMAGLNIIRLINEPTAAAIAYNLNKSEFEKYFVVYDLVGSRFDVAVMTVDDGVLEILAINGNTRLGGQNFDNRLIEYLILKMDRTWNGSDQCRSDPQAMEKLRKEAETAKIALSSKPSVEIKIESFCNGLDLREIVTRSQFEELNMDLFQETLVYVDKVLKDGGISKQEVNDVILVGGSTNIPKIVELIEQHFGRKLVLNGINPEQAVVYGTAIQGGVISGMFGDPEVLAFDLYPLSLGIETAGGIMTKIVERNTQIPLSKSHVFPIKVDEQGTAPICFYQGERALARNNNKLECIALEGVTKSSRGIANIEVGISIDINALVSVSAMDTESGKLREINIDSLLNIDEEQLERMIQEAEEKFDEDQVLLENIDARIGFEDYLYSVMHEISNLELSMEEKSTVLGEIRNSEVWMKSNSVAKKSEVRERMLEFNESVHPILQKYRTLENKRHDEL